MNNRIKIACFPNQAQSFSLGVILGISYARAIIQSYVKRKEIISDQLKYLSAEKEAHLGPLFMLRHCHRLLRFLFMLAGILIFIWCPLSVLSQDFSISEVFPQPHSQLESRQAPIQLVFSEAIDQNPDNIKKIKLYGSQQGFFTIQFRFPEANTIELDPQQALFAGEKLSLSIDTSLLSISGLSLPRSYHMEWTAPVNQNPGPNFLPKILQISAGVFVEAQPGDLDQDSDPDLIYLISGADSGLFYLENQGGALFSPPHLISKSMGVPGTLRLADLDQDGRLDIVCSSLSQESIYFFRNQGNGSFQELEIKNLRGFAEHLELIDFDGDGWIDIFPSSDQNLIWLKNQQALGFSLQEIDNRDRDLGVVLTGDPDNDLDIDLIAHIPQIDLLRWFENTQTNDHNFPLIEIARQLEDLPALVAVDLDNDRDQDLLSICASQGRLTWHENRFTQVFTDRLLDEQVSGARDIISSDVNGDQYPDVLLCMPDKPALFIYQNISGVNFQKRLLDSLFQTSQLSLSDVDSDGDLDMLACAQHQLVLFLSEPALAISSTFPRLNANGVSRDSRISVEFSEAIAPDFLKPSCISVRGEQAGVITGQISLEGNTLFFDSDLSFLPGDRITVFVSDSLQALSGNRMLGPTYLQFYVESKCAPARRFKEHVISDAGELVRPRGVHASDLDQDGDVDILAASQDNNRIAWYQNLRPQEPQFSSLQIINDNLRGAWQVFAGDLDGDKDQDVISGSFLDTDNLWYQNLGQGAFGPKQLISSLARRSVVVHLADIDTDGDLDVLTGSQQDGTISWYQNDGRGHFGPKQVISEDIGEIVRLIDEDLDQDGDQDLIAASFLENKIVWYQNDGKAGFSKEKLITDRAEGASGVFAIDIDGDQDLDVIACSFQDDEVSWYENNGLGEFIRENQIPNIVGSYSDVHATDLNGDGFMDILLASESGRISWNQNDGKGNFGETLMITENASSSNEVYAADFDNDGDMDVVAVASGNGQLAWYENQRQLTDRLDTLGIQVVEETFNFCLGDSVLLSATHNLPDLSIFWVDQNGEVLGEGNELYVKESGSFQAKAQYFCDSLTSSPLEITFQNPPPLPEIVPPLDSVIFCPGQSLILQPKFQSEAAAYFWWKDQQLLFEGLRLPVEEAGVYQLEVRTDCGARFSNEYVLNPIEIFVPDRFSPNQDGQNDFFNICVNQPWAVAEMSLDIYDRQGNLIFESQDSQKLLCRQDAELESGWNGQGVAEGLYIWQLRISLMGCQQKEMQGRVWLNR